MIARLRKRIADALRWAQNRVPEVLLVFCAVCFLPLLYMLAKVLLAHVQLAFANTGPYLRYLSYNRWKAAAAWPASRGPSCWS